MAFFYNSYYLDTREKIIEEEILKLLKYKQRFSRQKGTNTFRQATLYPLN